jgi:hypothetical protein
MMLIYFRGNIIDNTEFGYYGEMSLVADKYSENDPVPCSIDDLSVTEIRDELKK